MQTIKDIQAEQMAGHTKLTAVSVYSNGCRTAAFMPMKHDAQGRAVMHEDQLNALLTKVNCTMRGQTYSVG